MFFYLTADIHSGPPVPFLYISIQYRIVHVARARRDLPQQLSIQHKDVATLYSPGTSPPSTWPPWPQLTLRTLTVSASTGVCGNPDSSRDPLLDQEAVYGSTKFFAFGQVDLPRLNSCHHPTTNRAHHHRRGVPLLECFAINQKRGVPRWL